MHDLPSQVARALRARAPFCFLTSAFCLLLSSLSSPAAPRAELRFTDPRPLTTLGLQLRVMSGSREKPLPIPQAYPYRVRMGAEEFKTDMVDPRELWIASQHAAEWEDGDGNRLSIATVRTMLPGPFEREHIMKDEYDKALEQERAANAWTLPQLGEWMDAFAGTAGGTRVARINAPSQRFSDVLEFTFPPATSNTLAFAFRLNPAAMGQSHVPASWTCALFHLGPNTDPRTARQSILSRFLLYVTAAPVAKPTPLAPATRFQTAAPQTATAQSPEFLTSRKQVTASLANLRNWWFAETENYILISNMQSSERSTVRQLQTDVENLRLVFRKMIPPRAPLVDVSVIRMPATEEEYIEYVGPDLAWSGGLWMPTRKELVIRPLSGEGSRERRDHLLHAAYHESFHQYLFYALDHVETSLWFNEGHAVLFENVEFRNRGVQILENKDMARLLEQLLPKQEMTLRNVLDLNMDAFYAQSEATRAINYTMAWGLVYYLRQGVAAERKSPYAGLLDRYIDLLWQTRNPAAATDQTFRNVNLLELDRDFRAFWANPRRRAAAERITLAP